MKKKIFLVALAVMALMCLMAVSAFAAEPNTNGETVRVNLLSTDIDGWSAVTSPGTYTMTVKYSENGVSTQTTYKINVAAP